MREKYRFHTFQANPGVGSVDSGCAMDPGRFDGSPTATRCRRVCHIAALQRRACESVASSVKVFTASFPSGHAAISAITYLTLAVLLARTTPSDVSAFTSSRLE